MQRKTPSSFGQKFVLSNKSTPGHEEFINNILFCPKLHTVYEILSLERKSLKLASLPKLAFEKYCVVKTRLVLFENYS